MLKKCFLIAMAIMGLLHSPKAQETVGKSPVKWYTIEQAMELKKKVNKPLFIDMYTDWCGWCVKMMNETFTDKTIAEYLNSNFYPVRFNAEGKDTIRFRDTVYVNKGKTHDLALKLMDKQLSYPTIVYIDKQDRKYAAPGYLNAIDQLPLLCYFSEEVYQTTGYEEYKKNFRITYPEDGHNSMIFSKVKWYTLNEALKLTKTAPRKIFLDLYAYWSASANVMTSTTYNDSAVAKVLNEKYYPVTFNVLSADTIENWGYKFVNPNPNKGYHQLIPAMLNNKLTFPANVYLNEESKLMNVTQVYLTAEAIEPILNYFGDDAFKTKKWEDYQAEWFQKKNAEKARKEAEKNKLKK